MDKLSVNDNLPAMSTDWVRVKVRVCQDDIENGSLYTPRDCPIARAVKRVVTNKDVSILPHDIRIGHQHFLLPDKASEWLISYDHEKNVKPIEFEIELPENLIEK